MGRIQGQYRYLCDRCGRAIKQEELHTEGGTVYKGVSGDHRFHIQVQDEQFPHRHRTIVMCQDCWDKFRTTYNKFMARKKKK